MPGRAVTRPNARSSANPFPHRRSTPIPSWTYRTLGQQQGCARSTATSTSTNSWMTRSSSASTSSGPDGRTVPYPAPGVAGSTFLAQHPPVVSSPRRPRGVRRRRHSSWLVISCFQRTECCPFGRPTDVNALLGRVVTGSFGRAVLFRPRYCAPGVDPTCEHAGGRLLRTTGNKLNPLNHSCRGPRQL